MLHRLQAPDKILVVFNQVFIQMYFTPEEFHKSFIRSFLSGTLRTGISERMKTGVNLQRTVTCNIIKL